MKYQLKRTSDNAIMVEAARINDCYLVQQVGSALDHGCFDDGLLVLCKDGVEIDPVVVIEKDTDRYEAWLARKQETHRQITIIKGASVFGSKHKVWVRK